MANVKIPELPALASPSPSDLVPVADVSTANDEVKKTTVGEIVGIITGDVEVATDGTATISELPVSKLQDGAARQLLQTAANGVDVEWTDDVDLPGTIGAQGGFSIGTVTITAGTGAPEGSVSATVGSLYLRTDGTPNNTLYVKESGSGNSGWGAVPTQALLVN